MTPLSGSVFQALSNGVICFVPRLNPRNHFLAGQNSPTANQRLFSYSFSKLSLGIIMDPNFFFGITYAFGKIKDVFNFSTIDSVLGLREATP